MAKKNNRDVPLPSSEPLFPKLKGQTLKGLVQPRNTITHVSRYSVDQYDPSKRYPSKKRYDESGTKRVNEANQKFQKGRTKLPKSSSQEADEYIASRRKFQQRRIDTEMRMGNPDKKFVSELKTHIKKTLPDINEPNYKAKKKKAGYPVMSKKEAKSRVKQRRKINSKKNKKK